MSREEYRDFFKDKMLGVLCLQESFQLPEHLTEAYECRIKFFGIFRGVVNMPDKGMRDLCDLDGQADDTSDGRG